MLTDKRMRSLTDKDKPYNIADGNGLHVHVAKTGHRSWRYKYRYDGKERLLVLGSYPEVSLANARERRDDAPKILREGRDPRVRTC